ncbi:MAG: hypothetical protein KTR32_28970 [Granulosicoccus sp.]|nr:hypothetical protein [Granulosicoccus sp.]
MKKINNTCDWLAVVMLMLAAMLLPVSTLAAEPVSKSSFRGIAIGGHDSVEYHNLTTEPHASAVAGKKSFVVKWKGAKWRFLSQASADAFSANPEKYSPAYNGFCANALSLGKGLLKTDGTHWEIFGDKLYLFYAAAGRERWVAVDDQAEFIASADAAWVKLSQ